MKLIEKMAEEARTNGVHLDPATAHEDGFMAGFLACRELAEDTIRGYAHSGINVYRRQVCYAVIARVQVIGESEVKG